MGGGRSEQRHVARARKGMPSPAEAPGAAARDPTWVEFVERWRPMLRAYVRYLACLRADRDELVMDVLVSALELTRCRRHLG